jgi:hypothetical protein
MSNPVKILVVSYDSLYYRRKLLGAVTTVEAATAMISADFVKNGDADTFEVLMDDESTRVCMENEVLTTIYPIVEQGEASDTNEECYMVQETWLYS